MQGNVAFIFWEAIKKSYNIFYTWSVGVLILFITIATAFIGYLLAWGRISFISEEMEILKNPNVWTYSRTILGEKKIYTSEVYLILFTCWTGWYPSSSQLKSSFLCGSFALITTSSAWTSLS